jgi:choice-of-anchor B domain-containing protein
MRYLSVLGAVLLLVAMARPGIAQEAHAGDPVVCEDGVAAGFPCRSMTLLARVPLADLGSPPLANDVWGWTDPDTGREYALLGLATGTVFLDVTTPTAPVLLGTLPRTEGSRVASWRDVKVYRNHAFIVADAAGSHGMQVFDLTQLRDVTDPPVTFAATARYDGFGSTHNIVINEETGFGYAVGASSGGQTCGSGLHMIDLRAPRNPTFAGCFAEHGYVHDAQCVVYRGPDADYQGRELCFNAIGPLSSGQSDALSIVDVTDKDAPVGIARVTYPQAGYGHQGWLSEDHQHFFFGDESDERNFPESIDRTRTLVWDVIDLDSPVLATDYRGEATSIDHNMYVLGDYLYQANYTSGLRLLDVSQPTAPSEIAFFDVFPDDNAQRFTGAWSVYPYFQSGTVLISSMDGGLFVVTPGLALRPAARDDRVTGRAGAQLRVDVLENDRDPNGDPLDVDIIEQPAQGTATLNADGTVSYRPDGFAPGTDSFRYRVTDATGASDEATVTVRLDAADAAQAQVQFIHGVADPALATVDLYLADTLLVDDLAFQRGTAFLTLPGDEDLAVGLAPGTSTSVDDTLATATIRLASAATHVVTLEGVTTPEAFPVNPAGESTALAVRVREDAPLRADQADDVAVFVVQATPDAARLTVTAGDAGGTRTLAQDLPYGTASDDTALRASGYEITVTAPGAPTPFRFDLDLSDRAGEAVTLLITGFLDPPADAPTLTLAPVTIDGTVAAGIVVDTDEAPPVPDGFTLSPAYPNPFNPTTTLTVTLPARQRVTVAAYDVLGRRVATLHEGALPAGTHALTFDAAGLPSGTYVLRAVGPTSQQTRTVTLVK